MGACASFASARSSEHGGTSLTELRMELILFPGFCGFDQQAISIYCLPMAVKVSLKNSRSELRHPMLRQSLAPRYVYHAVRKGGIYASFQVA